ncbi:MAG TPA: hypothetical protein VFQ87_01675 [Bradyrhizobium sp.]|nr:hypothetical protein [Bradyrhizobium sp.]
MTVAEPFGPLAQVFRVLAHRAQPIFGRASPDLIVRTFDIRLSASVPGVFRGRLAGILFHTKDSTANELTGTNATFRSC